MLEGITEQVIYQHLIHGEGEIDEIKWTLTLKDGVVIAKEKHTENFKPGQKLTRAQPSTKALAKAIWKPDSVKAWSKKFEDQVAAAQAARDAEQAAMDTHLVRLRAREAEIAEATQRLTAAQAAYAAAAQSLAVARQAFRATAQELGAAEADAYKEATFTLTGAASKAR